MPTRDEYRRKASECMAQAEGLQFPEERVLMLVIAEAYIKMAERVAVRYGRGTAHRDQSEAHPQDDS